MRKIGVVSLGCPKNTVDSELLLGDLAVEGYEFTADSADAEIIIVNTCGFVEAAKRESINTILEMARLKTGGQCRKLVVTGCLAERYSADLLRDIPEIDLLLGVNQYPQLKELLRQDGAPPARGHASSPAVYYENYGQRALLTPFYSAYLKIGEGCSHQCAFCAIPKIRGPFRSRPLEAIAAEAGELARRGVKEFNLVSQVTTLYGADLGMKEGLAHLLRALAKTPGAAWLRLLYCYPTLVTEELLRCIRGEEKICRYIDVPLQHVHDDVLRSMKRQERERDIRAMIGQARRLVPGIALRTTFLVGFPGETDAHFQRLLDFVRETEFDHAGVFAYSNEEGTAAYNYPERVPKKTANARRDELLRTQMEIARRKNAARVGQTYPVLVEGLERDDSHLVTGRAPFQAPEIDGQIIIEESDVTPGQIVPMRVTRAMDYDLIARAQTMENGKTDNHS